MLNGALTNSLNDRELRNAMAAPAQGTVVEPGDNTPASDARPSSARRH
jgi:hypothetical protein